MKKIMFNDKFGLTQAVLEGRKTMTRRIVRNPEEVEINGHAYIRTEKLRYKVGNIVAVAQNYKDSGFHPDTPIGGKRMEEVPGWTNKMFVQGQAMRYFIRITSVRVERLQDISDEDCIREGIKEVPFAQYSWTDNEKMALFDTPRDAFAALIDKVSGKGTWESNPWVYVYEFELI